MTKSDEDGAIKAFATFRVAGDRLVPAEITRILSFQPALAYAKGEKYSPGPERPALSGKTGVWFLATDRILASADLVDHLDLLVGLLVTPRHGVMPFLKLRDVIGQRELEAHVTCFWHGPGGVKAPALPPYLRDFFGLIPADIALDFDTEEPRHRRKVA